jgi:5-methylcytosine-specific restriction enzyme A
MPQNAGPLRYCLAPGCHALVRRGYCRDCRPPATLPRANADVRRWYMVDRWRAPGGYRAQCLARDPFCVVCLAAGRLELATDVDHVVPHHGDPEKFWSLANLQGLCHRCHSRKTAAEGRRNG